MLVPGARIAQGKLAQAIAHGARVLAIDGSFDDALRLAREATAELPVALVNSVNPYRIAGQKTAAMEVVDSLGDAPEQHWLPVGNAGNITAYWQGYREYFHAERARSLPRMMGVQAAGAARSSAAVASITPRRSRPRFGSQSCLLGRRDRSPRPLRRLDHRGDRRTDSRRLAAPRTAGGHLLRARLRRLRAGLLAADPRELSADASPAPSPGTDSKTPTSLIGSTPTSSACPRSTPMLPRDRGGHVVISDPVDLKRAEAAVRELLLALGEDPIVKA